MAAMLDPASSPDPREDVAALRAQVAALTARLDVATRAVAARDRVIETLKDQLAALRRRSFGQSSEKLGRAADQLELQIEDLEQETAAAAVDPFVEPLGATACGFRSKSATCSGMKSAADSDLKSAVPI
jgi:predicted RNase H-like nuclease (RuvC/YqgF family)